MHRLPALAVVAAFVLSVLVPPDSAAAQTFRGVEFPQGAASFADAVVSYAPDLRYPLRSDVKNPGEALGPPDDVTGIPAEYVSLGNGGSITLRFVDNALTGSGNTNKDLWIFEIGPAVEDTDVAISRDGVAWLEVGTVAGSTSGLDVDPFVPDPATPYSFVRLTDVATEDFDTGNTAGADIDAVGAISTFVRPSDTTPPQVTVPADLTAEATGSGGAAVAFEPSANDLVDGPLTPACSPAPGALFALGTTTVTCAATDAAGNTGSAEFDVTVQDTTPPVLTLPDNLEEEATGADGAVVSYSASAVDLVDGNVDVACDPPSGDTFPIGSTTVECSTLDTAGNTGSGTFAIGVGDTTAPDIDGHADIAVEASGPDGALVTYDAPATHDAVDGDGAASCSPATGTIFALGSTAVTCDATDSHGNAAAPTSFMVTVVDTTGPVITGLPADLTVVAAGAGGAAVSWTAPTASDAVDVSVEVTCDPPSGTTFPVGSTTVTCAATDAAGNLSSAVFVATVVYGVCPQFDQSKAVKAGAVKPVRVELCTADGENLSDPGLVLNAVGLQKVDGTPSPQIEDPGNANSPDSNFRYDGGGYVFNLATGDLSTGTWELQFTVNGNAQVYGVRFDVR